MTKADLLKGTDLLTLLSKQLALINQLTEDAAQAKLEADEARSELKKVQEELKLSRAEAKEARSYAQRVIEEAQKLQLESQSGAEELERLRLSLLCKTKALAKLSSEKPLSSGKHPGQ
jgi:hypothetical protein